jgi:hypothetical protein
MNQPALIFWSRLIQAAAGVVLALSAVLLFAPSLGETFFNLVYFHQPGSPVPVPIEAQGYIRFANGIIGAVMAGWMLAIIVLARRPFQAGERYAWNAIAWPLLAWYLVDTAFSLAHGAQSAQRGVCCVASRRASRGRSHSARPAAATSGNTPHWMSPRKVSFERRASE